MSDWSTLNPDIPEPKTYGDIGGDVDVEIKANGAVLKFSFDSMAEAQQFIDAYGNAHYVSGTWERPIQRRAK